MRQNRRKIIIKNFRNELLHMIINLNPSPQNDPELCLRRRRSIVKWKSLSCVRLFVTPKTIQSMEFSKPEYWSGYLFPSPGDLPNQGSNPGLPHCRQILYQLSHKGSPRILEWVSYPFSSRSTWPRNPIDVSCIAGRFFTNSTIRDPKPGILKHWYRDSLYLVVVATRC